MGVLYINYSKQGDILNQAQDARQHWGEAQEHIKEAISYLEGYGSIAPETVVIIGELCDEIDFIQNKKETLQGFIGSFSRYLDQAREAEEGLKQYINESSGYTCIISDQYIEREGQSTIKFILGGAIIVGSIILAFAFPGCAILVGIAVGATSGGAIGAGLTALMGGDYNDVADAFFAGTVTGAIEGGFTLGAGYPGLGKYLLRDMIVGMSADFGYGMINSAIEGDPNGFLVSGLKETFNPINLVTNLGTGMFGAGIGSGTIKFKRPSWLKLPEMKSSFKSGAVSNLFADLQIKNSKRISNFIDKFNLNSNKFSSQIKRESPEIYEKLNRITKDISNSKYVTMSMNGTGQLRNIALEKINKLAKEIPELEAVIKNCTDEDQLKKIVKMCDDGDVDGLKKAILEDNPVANNYVNYIKYKGELAKAELKEMYPDFVAKKNSKILQTSDELLEKELVFAQYGKLEKVPFDNLTGHHMPSNYYMKEKFNIDMDDSLAFNLEQLTPGVGGRHRRTFTYGFKGRGKELYLNLMPRDALAFDVNDIRRILQEDGLYNSESRKALSAYISYYKKMAPGVFKK